MGQVITAFRNRMNNTGLPDGLNENALNQTDRQLNCAGCHIPIMRTGQSSASVGARHLSHKWVPMFSDLLLHDMGEVTVERISAVLRAPTTIGSGLDIPRNLADDALPGQGNANGREWRTPPLMGLGITGAPFMHDARVFINAGSPARTVQSIGDGTTITTINSELVITTIDDAIRAAIELHDLPETDATASCPNVLPLGTTTGVCPGVNDNQRSEARNVMARWRTLTAAQQQDVINFLKSL